MKPTRSAKSTVTTRRSSPRMRRSCPHSGQKRAPGRDLAPAAGTGHRARIYRCAPSPRRWVATSGPTQGRLRGIPEGIERGRSVASTAYDHHCSQRRRGDHGRRPRASMPPRSTAPATPQVRALDGVTVDFDAGRFTAIMGPSGSGKSHPDALRGRARLAHLRHTSIIGGTDLTRLDDKELTRLRRDQVGFVFQAFNLIPTLTALENITLPMDLAGRKPDQEWLDDVDRHRRPGRPPPAPAERAVRRPAAAGGGGPRAGRAAGDHLRRRAHRQPRLPRRRRDPRLHAAGRDRARPDHRDGHPRPGGGVLRRPVVFLPTAGSSTRWPTPPPRPCSTGMKALGRLTDADASPSAPSGRTSAASSPRSLAVVLGVAFMAGTFVLTDTIQTVVRRPLRRRRTPSIDAQVQGEVLFASDFGGDQRAPLDQALLDTVAEVDGVADAAPYVFTSGVGSTNRVLGADGEPIGAVRPAHALRELDRRRRAQPLRPRRRARAPRRTTRWPSTSRRPRTASSPSATTSRVVTQHGQTAYELVGIVQLRRPRTAWPGPSRRSSPWRRPSGWPAPDGQVQPDPRRRRRGRHPGGARRPGSRTVLPDGVEVDHRRGRPPRSCPTDVAVRLLVLHDHPLGLRRPRPARRHLRDLQHLLDPRRPAHAGAGPAAGRRRQPAAGARLGAARGRRRRPRRSRPRPGGGVVLA